MSDFVVRKVWVAKKKGVKLITIPKHSDINEGDMVLIKKVESKDMDDIISA